MEVSNPWGYPKLIQIIKDQNLRNNHGDLGTHDLGNSKWFFEESRNMECSTPKSAIFLETHKSRIFLRSIPFSWKSGWTILILILPNSAIFFRMYLLQKYDALSGLDHAEFISKDVPPWHISHDTCGPQVEPPAARSRERRVFFAWEKGWEGQGKHRKPGRSSVSERITRRCNNDSFLGQGDC